MQMQWDVIVVGAGPAGMCAAMQCADYGLDVLIVDRQAQAGGQIWKNAGSASLEQVQFLGREYKQGAKLVRDFMQAKLTFIPRAQVWHVDKNTICVSVDNKSYYLMAKALVLATGAMERPAPVKGWDLPEVMGAGACDLLLKSAGLTPQAPVVICGNGPLIVQTLAHLCQLKIPVAGMVLTGMFQKNAWNAFLNSPKILSRPLYFMHGITLSLTALLKKIPTFFNAQNIRISEEDTVSVDFMSGGKARSLEGKSVLVHEGIVSETRITMLAQCRHIWNANNRYWHATADAWGQTNVQGLFIAGDVGGVGGAAAALSTGSIVGLGICYTLGKISQNERDRKVKPHQRRLLGCKWMQDFTDALFKPNPSALLPEDDTIVCRCEEISAKTLRDTIVSGCYSTDAVKAQCRCGMGYCQGRMCSSSVAELIANVHAIPLENLPSYTARPPLFPLNMGELAEMSLPNLGL